MNCYISKILFPRPQRHVVIEIIRISEHLNILVKNEVINTRRSNRVITTHLIFSFAATHVALCGVIRYSFYSSNHHHFQDWLEQDVLAALQGAVHLMHSQIVDDDDDDDVKIM